MKDIVVNFTLNGEVCKANVKSDQTLLSLLREDLRLTGTKCGCNVGECGACTVLMNDQSVNACLILAPQIEGSKIVTIEGLSNGNELDPLQKAFVENGAVQCGFCTPGMIASIKSLLLECPKPSEEQIRSSISGNLCRCTGYEQIIRAVKDAIKHSP